MLGVVDTQASIASVPSRISGLGYFHVNHARTRGRKGRRKGRGGGEKIRVAARRDIAGRRVMLVIMSHAQEAGDISEMLSAREIIRSRHGTRGCFIAADCYSNWSHNCF